MKLRTRWTGEFRPELVTVSFSARDVRLVSSVCLTAGCVLWAAVILGPANAVAADIHNGKSAKTAVENAVDAETAEIDPLVAQVEEAIAISSRRYLTVGLHTPWQIMHGLLALRQDFQIMKGDEKIAAIDWLSDDAAYQGQSLFQVTEYGGQAHPYTEPYAFEGHRHQFLAFMASADLSLDYKLKADTGTLTIGDLVKDAQMQFDGTDEGTWTLWALSLYLGPDAQWTNRWGQRWSIEDLMRMQLNQRDKETGE